MLTHKRIRERQAECRAAYGAGSITVAEYVDTMNRLNDELKAAEEKMYEAAGHLDNLDLLRFITGTIPTAFKKIHARFPHLTFDEVIAFEQTVREAGGSRMTHSGMFVPTLRTWYYKESGRGKSEEVIMSWGCCNSRGHDGNCGVANNCAPNTKANQYGIYECQSIYASKIDKITGKLIDHPHLAPSPDLMNRSPIGACSYPSIFSLTDEVPKFTIGNETESQKNECTIVEIKSATQARIDKIEAEISELRRKAGYFNDLLKTLDALSN